MDKYNCKVLPSVYRYIDKGGNVIYVGKTKRPLTQRINEHRGEAIASIADRIEFACVDNEAQMNQYESYYINKYKPKYNVASVYSGDPVCLPELEWFKYGCEAEEQHPKSVVMVDGGISTCVDYDKSVYSTIKDVANSLGIDKQRVYRYAKRNPELISMIHSPTNTWLFDKKAVDNISAVLVGGKQDDKYNKSNENDGIINALLKELEKSTEIISTLYNLISNLQQ